MPLGHCNRLHGMVGLVSGFFQPVLGRIVCGVRTGTKRRRHHEHVLSTQQLAGGQAGEQVGHPITACGGWLCTHEGSTSADVAAPPAGADLRLARRMYTLTSSTHSGNTRGAQ